MKLFRRRKEGEEVHEAPEVPQFIEAMRSKADLSVADFSLGPTLGTGTFGRVFHAQHKETGKYCAIKKLKKVEVVRLKQVEHVANEKNILLSTWHPFIVNLWSTFKDIGALYMVMEFVQGGELFTHLRKQGRFKPSIAQVYIAEVCLALSYLHDLDIIYRDLKPENLLVTPQGHIKITDFGFAKVVKDKTWTLCGTPEYLCPEIIQSKGHGYEADWWALGILTFELLAGYPPFFDENPFGIYEKILACKIPFPAYFEQVSMDLIKKLCQPDRTRRLGCLKGGASDIKKHKFFKGINWKDLVKTKKPGPLTIAVTDLSDTSNFDKYPAEKATKGPTKDPFESLFKDW